MKLPHRLRRSAGNQAERLAASYLTRQGLRIVTLNYHCRQGEIDVIATEGETLVFVEVRMRQNACYGTPAETVTRHKQTRIICCARYFLMHHPRFAEVPCRFDIVGISPAANRRGSSFDWLKDAFQSPV